MSDGKTVSTPESEYYDNGATVVNNWSGYTKPEDVDPQTEEERQVQSVKGLIIETINIAYNDYNIGGLKFFRLRVKDMKTLGELKIASDLLGSIINLHKGN